MWQLLQDNILDGPDIAPLKGRLSLEGMPGLGLTPNRDVIAKASERFLSRETLV